MEFDELRGSDVGLMGSVSEFKYLVKVYFIQNKSASSTRSLIERIFGSRGKTKIGV